MSKTLLVTGSSGLIGSEVCSYFARELGYAVHGVDNNQRAVFFGPQGDTKSIFEKAVRSSMSIILISIQKKEKFNMF